MVTVHKYTDTVPTGTVVHCFYHLKDMGAKKLLVGDVSLTPKLYMLVPLLW